MELNLRVRGAKFSGYFLVFTKFSASKFEVKFDVTDSKKGESDLTSRSKFNAEFKGVKFDFYISVFYPFFLDCRMRTNRR